MIQLHRQALLICHADGQMEPLDIHGLMTHLMRQTEMKETPIQPWILEQLVTSLISHFNEDLQRDRVLIAELEKAAEMLLKSFFEETLQEEQSRNELDLFETAHRHGNGFELGFFMEIRRFLNQRSKAIHLQSHKMAWGEKATSLTHLRITGLRRCSKLLSGKQRWSKNCVPIQDEIVTYIRREILNTGISDLSLELLS